MPLCRTGMLKACYKLDKEKSQIGRPVHDYSEVTPVILGEINEYVIEINPIGMVFDPGTSIQLEIKAMDNYEHQAGAWQAKMDHLGPIPSAGTINYKIYRDKDYQSHILMPYIPETKGELWLQPIIANDIGIGASGKGSTH
jgi:predicted acyl esterase